MAALTISEIKINSQILSRIPVLVGQSNYSIWHVKIRNTLSTYGVWEIVEGTNTYATTIAADQEKWKLLDRHVLGLVASTLDNSLINHVSYTWAPPVGTASPTFPSVAKALMDKLHTLFGTTGLTGQFLLFHKVMRNQVKPQTANENISSLIQLFDQLRQAGLNLPQSFRTMILLSHLSDDMFTLASTITQTIAVANFDLETVASRILAEIDLWAMRRPLASRISAVQSEESSANRTTVIRCGPPPQNKWKGQTNSYQNKLPYQRNQSGQNQHGSGFGQQNQSNQKGKGPARAKNPSKQQKRSWYDQRKQQQQQQANPKGKGKANKVMFVNEVEMYNASVEEGETPLVFDENNPLFEDDPLFRFIDHLEEGEEGELMDVDEDASSTVTHVGWDQDGEGLNIAGPSQPFQHNSF